MPAKTRSLMKSRDAGETKFTFTGVGASLESVGIVGGKSQCGEGAKREASDDGGREFAEHCRND